MAFLRPVQLFPLLNALSPREHYPDLEDFRDLVEALFVVAYPLTLGKPLNGRHLPWSPYRNLAKRILALARHIQARADPRLLPSVTRCTALWALTAFLHYVIPRAPEQGPAIIGKLSEFGAPARWVRGQDVFQYLFARTVAVLSTGDDSLPFSVSRPAEPHRNIQEMLRVLSRTGSCSVEALAPLLPSLMGFLTLGAVSFLPIVWLRVRRGTIVAAVEVWDQTAGALGDRSLPDALAQTPRQQPIRGCRAQRFLAAYESVLSRFVVPYERPLGRAQLLGSLPRPLGALIRKHLVVFGPREMSCPYCRSVFCDPETKEMIEGALTSLPSQSPRFQEAARLYPDWLIGDCLRRVLGVLEIEMPFVVAGLFRPRFAPRCTGERWRPRGSPAL